MSEVSRIELHDFVSEQLSWLANFLMTKYGLKASEAKQIMSETLVRDV